MSNVKLMKYVLFAFNLVFFIAGVGLIITGACVETKFKEYFEFSENSNMSAVAIFLIVVGVVIVSISFFGCCGAFKENVCMLITFSVLLGFIFILQITAGIAAYVLRDKIQTLVKINMGKSIPKYGLRGGVTTAWDAVQTHLKCCGLKSYNDWQYNANLTVTKSVPDSCCIKIVKDCGLNKQGSSPTGIHLHPCLAKFEAFVKQNIFAIGGVGVGLAFIQLVGMALSCYLARAIKLGLPYEEMS